MKNVFYLVRVVAFMRRQEPDIESFEFMEFMEFQPRFKTPNFYSIISTKLTKAREYGCERNINW